MPMTSNKPLSRAFLGAGWQFPIRVNPQGGLSYSTGEQNVIESIWIVLSTALHERQMRPKFGCGIQDLVFAPMNPATYGNIAQLVRKALTACEARIDVLGVQVGAADDEAAKMLIRVDYRIRATNSYGNIVYPFFVKEGPGI